MAWNTSTRPSIAVQKWIERHEWKEDINDTIALIFDYWRAGNQWKRLLHKTCTVFEYSRVRLISFSENYSKLSIKLKFGTVLDYNNPYFLSSVQNPSLENKACANSPQYLKAIIPFFPFTSSPRFQNSRTFFRAPKSSLSHAWLSLHPGNNRSSKCSAEDRRTL